jgi:hypothetical protein
MMFRKEVAMRALRTAAVAAASILVLTASACSGSTGNGASQANRQSGRASPHHEISDRDFDPDRFNRSTVIDNLWLPMRPGMRFVWEGRANDGHARVSRRVVFTVTDLTKFVDGVRTVVAWDQDFTAGYLEENEIAFFAQDDDGNVWHFGQYPEEYSRQGRIKGAPAWIAGLRGARPGISMKANPRLGTPSYAQGWGPDVHWNDRARVYRMGESTCVPVRCYRNVLVTDEFNRDEPGAHQLKYYAPGVGNIRVGWRGRNEEEREVLVLVKVVHLDHVTLRQVRTTVLAEEERAYQASKDLYGRTPPARVSS